MALKLQFTLPEKLYVKDPQTTSYGKRLLRHAIELMDDLGFEAFTFKKLAERMDSSEVSVYRYFRNKHLLLIYINCWYWEWVSYLIDIRTLNLMDPSEQLKRAIHCIIYASREAELNDYINEKSLQHVIMKEGLKTYHVAEVDDENKDGFFIPFKVLIEKMAGMVTAINPAFPYPRSLCSTLFEMVNNQLYYAHHLGRLTDIKQSDQLKELEIMLNHFAFGTISYQN